MVSENFATALTKCFFCGRDDKIILNTRLTPGAAKNVKEMHQKCVDMEPCPKCKIAMEKGVILITIDNSKSEPGWERSRMPNPYRTGYYIVVSEEFIRRALPDNLAEFGLKNRWMFVEHEVADRFGMLKEIKG